MNDRILSRVELFEGNMKAIKKDFAWHYDQIKRIAALLYAVEDRQMDTGAIKDSHEMIKRNTGVFSQFRGNMVVALAAMLALSADREAQLQGTLDVYGRLKDAGFRNSDYLAVAAFQIAAQAAPEGWDEVVARAKAFYDGMKQQHWFLTGEDDYLYCAMLGLSDVPVEAGVERIEQLYGALKPSFRSANGVQALAETLALGGESDAPTERLVAIADALRARGHKMGRENMLSSLGALALLDADPEQIAGDVAEACEMLRAGKGFGAWTSYKEESLLVAIALVASGQTDEAASALTSAVSGLTNVMIAMYTTMIAVIVTTSVVSSSSSN